MSAHRQKQSAKMIESDTHIARVQHDTKQKRIAIASEHLFMKEFD